MADSRKAESRRHLAELEKQQRAETPQLGLFAQKMQLEEEIPQPDPLRERVHSVDPDSLTHREALALLYDLKHL